MPLIYRRILTLLFLFILLIAGPAIVLYGAGYRINLQQKRLERVGLLHVTTDPNNTTMILDGQPHTVANELVLASLQPKEYDVVINKEGYHSWFKQLEVTSGQTTFIRDLLLFKETDPDESLTVPASAQFVAGNDKSAYFQSQSLLIRFDYESAITVEIELDNEFSIINPVFHENKFYFQQNALWYELSNLQLSKLEIPLTSPIQELISSDSTLYALTDEGVWEITDDTRSASLLIQQRFPQAMARKGSGFLLIATEPSQQRSFLYEYVSVSSRPRSVATLSYGDYQFIDEQSGVFSFYAQDISKLLLVDTNSIPEQIVDFPQTTSWEWSQRENQLLVTNDFEVSIRHFSDDNRQELLTRLSSPIQEAVWHTEEQHVIYVTNNALYLIERDERNQRNTFLLAQHENTPHILELDTSGEKIFYFTENENGEIKVWSLEIR
jgi:hypothetical protein